jgi:hypothetical protein
VLNVGPVCSIRKNWLDSSARYGEFIDQLYVGCMFRVLTNVGYVVVSNNGLAELVSGQQTRCLDEVYLS